MGARKFFLTKQQVYSPSRRRGM